MHFAKMNEDQLFEIEALKQIFTDPSEFQVDCDGTSHLSTSDARLTPAAGDVPVSVKGFFKVDFDVSDCCGDDGLTLEAYQLVRRNSAAGPESVSENVARGELRQRYSRLPEEERKNARKHVSHDKPALEVVEHAESILFLPPIIVYFNLPATYPNDAPPAISLSCSWLSKHHLRLLHDVCMQEWESVRGPILFQLHSFFRHEALQKIFNLTTSAKTLLFVPHRAFSAILRSRGNDISRTTVPEKFKISSEFRNVVVCADPLMVINRLSSFNHAKKREALEQSVQECPVCFGQDKFVNGFELTLCKHWFCRKCVQSYVKMHIKDGSVTFLKCLNDSCGKEITAGEVQQLVDADEFAKYDSTLLNVALSSMSDVIYCPRKFCQAAVLKDPNDKDAQCPACQFVFCMRCRRCNHGINPCPITGDIRRLAQLYEQADAVERERLETQYGRSHMLDAVNTIRSQSWIDANAKQCPNCKSSTEKFDGCNKIACSKCGCYWCWLCLRVLDKADPYKHYRDPNQGGCYNQLFRGLVHFDERGNLRENEDDAGEGDAFDLREQDIEFELFFRGDGADDDPGNDDDEDEDEEEVGQVAEFLRQNLMQMFRAAFGDDAPGRPRRRGL